jgi:hypothetical protein
MAAHPKSSSLAGLLKLRDHHVEQARRIDDAIALLRGVEAADPRAARRPKVKAKPARKAKRVVAAKPRRAAAWRKATPSAPRQEHLNTARHVFADAGPEATVTRDQIVAGLIPVVTTNERAQTPAAAANRAAGLMISRLVKGGEIVATHDGYRALKINLPAVAMAGVNGNGEASGEAAPA